VDRRQDEHLLDAFRRYADEVGPDAEHGEARG
jgi:hypothetical protein